MHSVIKTNEYVSNTSLPHDPALHRTVTFYCSLATADNANGKLKTRLSDIGVFRVRPNSAGRV